MRLELGASPFCLLPSAFFQTWKADLVSYRIRIYNPLYLFISSVTSVPGVVRFSKGVFNPDLVSKLAPPYTPQNSDAQNR